MNTPGLDNVHEQSNSLSSVINSKHRWVSLVGSEGYQSKYVKLAPSSNTHSLEPVLKPPTGTRTTVRLTAIQKMIVKFKFKKFKFQK
jgi:hypothetical protein